MMKNHWCPYEDYCIYCHKYSKRDIVESFGVYCECFVFPEKHAVRRIVHFICLNKIREIAEKVGKDTKFVISILEERNPVPTSV